MIFEQLTSIEDKANKIISSAEREKTLTIINAKKQADDLLAQTKQAAREEAAAIIEEAKLSGQQEKTALEAETDRQLEELRRSFASKLETAKKLCR
ncbi:MAG: hypothetical protein KKC80_04200 [Candidatus Margulisbacteria bacterium]|nr:hypothetical protein [Candidatus Margulisiibacteriota bacterium]